jgi:hypothetical protein
MRAPTPSMTKHWGTGCQVFGEEVEALLQA